MRLALLLVLFVVIVAFAAGIIVVHRNNDRTCIRYYAKDGSHELYEECR